MHGPSAAERVVRKVRETLGALAPGAPSPLWPGGVVSFTFDDFPRSALAAGGAILERRGARGTYYAALGLAGDDGPLGPLFRVEDLERARAAGHEIACHTFTHIDCGRSDVPAVLEEVRCNGRGLESLLGQGPSNFAFPFGASSPGARRALARRFRSCRGIRPGINRRPLDRSELKANKIYDGLYDIAALRALIDEACAAGGWVIFYTHDVSSTPSPYGCRPEQLERVAAYAAERACIRTVAEVMERIGDRP